MLYLLSLLCVNGGVAVSIHQCQYNYQCHYYHQGNNSSRYPCNYSRTLSLVLEQQTKPTWLHNVVESFPPMLQLGLNMHGLLVNLKSQFQFCSSHGTNSNCYTSHSRPVIDLTQKSHFQNFNKSFHAIAMQNSQLQNCQNRVAYGKECSQLVE